MIDKKNVKKTKIKKVLKIVRRVTKIILKTFLLIFFGFSLFLGFYVTKTLNSVPKVTESMLKEAVSQTSNMYASDGSIIWSDTSRKRDFLSIDETPENYLEFVIATEDNEFYESYGINLKGLFNAIRTKGQRGGSGIDQQVIKNLVFSSNVSDRTIDRKIKEAWLSIQMNNNFSKKEILEYYVNMINMGEGSYGANTIAITYYGISLKDMTGNDPQTLSKLAIIAGLGQAPSIYNLYDNPEAVEKRRNEVLLSALHHNKITKKMYKEISEVPIQEGLQERYWRNSNVISEGNIHSAYITSALNQVKELGYDLQKTPMQIYTGLNKQINSDVKNMFDSYWGYQNEQMQSAGTIIDPNTGFVMAQYGGRYGEAFGLNRATINTRSSGSSTKPFISYGPAIQYLGKGSGTILDSSNYVYPGTSIVAHNYGGYTYGNVTMANALKLSLNTPAIRILDEQTGSELTKEFLSKINLDVKDYYGGADALGLNISTEQLAAAHATLASYGTYRNPQYITKLKFNDGSEREISFGTIKAMNESTAYILLRMMEEVTKSGGTAVGAEIPNYIGYAVKTGTVGYDSAYGFSGDSASDVWIGGTTKNVSIAVWMGYDTPYEFGNQIHQNYHKAPHELFKQLMLYFNEGKDTSQWEKPETVIGDHVENLTSTDFGRKISKFYIPKVNSVNSSAFSKLSKSTSTEIEDEGIEKYKTPDDYEDIMNWQLNVDSNQLNDYNRFNKDPLRAVVNKESVFYNIEREQE